MVLTRSTTWSRRLLVATAVVVTVAAGIVTARSLAGRLSPHLYAGTVLAESAAAPPMEGLRYRDGAPVNLQAYDGRVVLVFFGYTSCPDVCPTTLSTVVGALDQLDDDVATDIELLMVTVDPARDTADVLDAYLDSFDPQFTGVTGDAADIDRVASLYGVFHEVSEVGNDHPASGSYLVDHTASLLAIGPDGTLRVAWAPGVGMGALAGDLADLAR